LASGISLVTAIIELATLQPTVVASGEIALKVMAKPNMGAIIGGTFGLIASGYTLYQLNL
jgi:hypothetical protein